MGAGHAGPFGPLGGLGLLSQGRAVGREGTGPNSGAHSCPLVAVLGRTDWEVRWGAKGPGWQKWGLDHMGAGMKMNETIGTKVASPTHGLYLFCHTHGSCSGSCLLFR